MPRAGLGPSGAFLLPLVPLAMGSWNFSAHRRLGDALLQFLFSFFTDRVTETHCEEVTLTSSGWGRAHTHGTFIFGPASRTLGISTGVMITPTENPRLLGGPGNTDELETGALSAPGPGEEVEEASRSLRSPDRGNSELPSLKVRDAVLLSV